MKTLLTLLFACLLLGTANAQTNLTFVNSGGYPSQRKTHVGSVDAVAWVSGGTMQSDVTFKLQFTPADKGLHANQDLYTITGGTNQSFAYIEIALDDTLANTTDTVYMTFTDVTGAQFPNSQPPSYMIILLPANSTTGLKEETLGSFSVYPNPANDIVYVTFDNAKQEHYTYTLFDSKLARVKEGRLNTNGEIGLTGLQKGLYLVQLTNEKGVSGYKKIMIE